MQVFGKRASDGTLSEIKINDSGALLTESNALGGGATAANQATEIASIASLDGKVPPKGSAAMAAATPVTLATDDAQMAALILALSQPTKSYAITPSDSTDLSSTVTKGLVVSVAGTLSLKLSGDSSATSITVVAGQYLPGKVLRVMTATTAAVVGLGG